MKITVRGQTIESFVIVVADDTGAVEEFDIPKLLVVNDADLERETCDAAAKEHFWNQIAITAEMELEDFDKTFYATYNAHTERFARYYLKAQGEKTPTGAAKEKAASLLYAEVADKDTCAHIAFQAYEEEMQKIGVAALDEGNFTDEMYLYEQSMEQIERIRLAMRHKASQLKAVSGAFNTKSWSIKTLAADRRAQLSANI
jgi:hypothetical protein